MLLNDEMLALSCDMETIKSYLLLPFYETTGQRTGSTEGAALSRWEFASSSAARRPAQFFAEVSHWPPIARELRGWSEYDLQILGRGARGKTDQ